jgi:hypothetical protein
MLDVKGTRTLSVAFSPALFWLLATTLDLVRSDPEALEAPLTYLLATYVYYGPVFATAVATHAVLGPPVSQLRSRWFLARAVISGALATLPPLAIANVVVDLPVTAWPLCVVVGGVMGGAFALAGGRGSLSSRFQAAAS